MQGNLRWLQAAPLWQKSVVRTQASKVKASEATFCMQAIIDQKLIDQHPSCGRIALQCSGNTHGRKEADCMHVEGIL